MQGGGLVFLLFLLRLRFAPADPAANPPPTEQPLRHSAAAVRQHLTWESVVLRFALVRAAAVTTAYGVGIAYFAAHPFLAATATLLIIRPAFDQTFVYAIERSLGTLLGAAVGIWLITIVQHPLPQLGTSLLLSFAMGAVLSVNYALYIALLTTILVWMTGLVGADPLSYTQDRVLETLIGLVLGIATIVLMGLLLPSTRAATDTDEQAEPATLPPT